MPCGCAVFTPSRTRVDLITRGVSLFGGTPRLFFGLMLLLGTFGGAVGGRVADAAPVASWAPATTVFPFVPATLPVTSAPATTVATPNVDAPANSQALPVPVVGANAATAEEKVKDPRPSDGASTDDHGEPTPSAIKQPWLQATLSIVLLLSTYLLFTLRTR